MKNENDTIVMPRCSASLLGRTSTSPWRANRGWDEQLDPFWLPWSLAWHWYQKNIFKLFTIYYLPTCLLSIDYMLFTTQLSNWLLEAFFLGGLPYRCGQAITSIGDFDIFKLFTIYYLPTCLLSIDYVLFTTQLFNWLLEAFFLGGLPYRCGQAITSIGDFEIVMNYWLNPFVFSIVHFLKGFKEFLKPAAILIFYLLRLRCTDGATLWENEVLLCILKRFFSCIFFVFLVIFWGGRVFPRCGQAITSRGDRQKQTWS